MKNQILIINDKRNDCAILQSILEETYDILLCGDGQEALDIIDKNVDAIHLIILKLQLPKLAGFGFLEALKKRELENRYPILVINDGKDEEELEACTKYQITDFLDKPFLDFAVLMRVRNSLNLYTYHDRLETEVKNQTNKVNAQYKLLMQQAKTLEKNNMRIIDVLSTVVEMRNIAGRDHIENIRNIVRILGNELATRYPKYQLTPETIEVYAVASALHDIGKILIPDEILLKPGKLTDLEFDTMKSHTARGCDILEEFSDFWEDRYQKAALDICRHHHERYDGSGYPDGLRGDETPISAQLVALADVYDSLLRENIHNKAHSKEEAYQMIVNGECGLFNPHIMQCFRNTRQTLEDLQISDNI